MTAPPDTTLTAHALLGDIVGSRRHPDRARLHRTVETALATVDAGRAGRLRVTVGDEFQGLYRSLGDALDAGLRIRLALLPAVDVRIGIGRGSVTTLDAAREVQDGPGWWAARAAMNAVRAAEKEHLPTRGARTLVADAGGGSAEVDAVNAALLLRDSLIASMSERTARILRRLMDPDVTQADVAQAEGISASAVSQRVRSDGVGIVLATHEMLAALP